MKSELKEKLIMFLLGLLVGVIISGFCFWFATKVSPPKSDNPRMETRQEMKRLDEGNSSINKDDKSFKNGERGNRNINPNNTPNDNSNNQANNNQV